MIRPQETANSRFPGVGVEAVTPGDEAAATFAALEATPWLHRARALSIETATA